MLDLGPDARPYLPHAFGHEVGLGKRDEPALLARSHRDLPRPPYCFGQSVHALIPGAAEGRHFITVEQRTRPDQVFDVRRCRGHGVGQVYSSCSAHSSRIGFFATYSQRK